jgi:four helix bundle protein
MKHTLSHENLDAYKLEVEVARWVRKTPFPYGESTLKDQARRAADSIVLNLAEGAYMGTPKERGRHFRIARGSAAEVCAVLDLVDLPDGPMRQAQLRRVVAMLCKLR